MTDREELNNIPVSAVRLSDGREVDLTTGDDADHFIVCAACGQAIDCRKLGDVFHHEEPGHEPLPVQ